MAIQSPARVRTQIAVPRPEFKLRKHADYQRVYREGKRQSLPLMTYFFAVRTPQEAAPIAGKPARRPAVEIPPLPRVGITAGKVLGNAVERNRIKRRMRHAIQRAQTELTASVDVVLHPRKAVLEAEFSDIERDVRRAFRAIQQALKADRDTDFSHAN